MHDKQKTNKILILLSTFNGEKFLREQIESLLHQNNVDLAVLIRDDGSKDSTLQILNEFKNQFPQKFTIIEGENIGWKRSFLELLKIANENYSQFEYFAFCDQDDIWLPQKIKRAIEKINTLPAGPKLYCSNLIYYKDGIDMGKIWNKKKYPTYKNCLIRNYATGCTIVFDYQLLKLVTSKFPKIEVAHDFWIYQVAVLCGNVYCDQESYIYYRQHDDNQIGIKNSRYDIWKRRITQLKTSYNTHDREDQAKELYRIFNSNFSKDASKAVTKIINYRENLLTKLSLMFDCGYTTNLKTNDLWLKLRILMGKL